MPIPDIIAIAGRPGIGKTTLAEKISKSFGHKVISTDKFIERSSFKESPEIIMSAVDKETENLVVEGVQVARMLKKGFKPDLVIEIECSKECEKRHRGLASMVENSMTAFKIMESGIPVVSVKNNGEDFEGLEAALGDLDV